MRSEYRTSSCQRVRIQDMGHWFLCLVPCIFLVFALSTTALSSSSEPISADKPTVERVEVLRGKGSMDDYHILVRAIIKGSAVTREDITADLSQLTGNPKDRSIKPLAKDVTIHGNYVQANWSARIGKGVRGGYIAISILNKAEGGKVKKIAQKVVFVPSNGQRSFLKDNGMQIMGTDSGQRSDPYPLITQVEARLPDILVYPNPVQFGQFGGVSKTLKFRNVPLGSVIEIYTVSGEKIQEIEVEKADVSWDGRKQNGDLVTSGLYLYRVRSAGKEVFGKIAVLR